MSHQHVLFRPPDWLLQELETGQMLCTARCVYDTKQAQIGTRSNLKVDDQQWLQGCQGQEDYLQQEVEELSVDHPLLLR